ncbi:MAG: LamG domain-containing protein, partial [Candidatus Nealsonbacteria bacterium]|nr:LamG domain-containing protein [Candidatus Nealsonbacteria bacterium]
MVSKRIVRVCLVVTAMVAMAGTAAAVDWLDDFESYTVGDINGQVMPWTDFGGDAKPTNISIDQAFSGTQSMKLVMGDPGYGSDVYNNFIGGEPARTTGQWSLAYQMYLTPDFDGNVLMYYNPPDRMINAGSTGTVFGDWAKVEMLIDLDAGTLVEASYDGIPFDSGTWSGNISYLNFWMDNGTTGAAYFDDFSLSAIELNTLTWDNSGSNTWASASSHWTGGTISYPDALSAAVLNGSNTISVSAPGAVTRTLSVDGSGGIAIDVGQTLTVTRGAEFASGTSLTLGAGATFSAGSGTIPAIAPAGDATIGVTVGEMTGGGYNDSTPLTTPRTFTKAGRGTLSLNNDDGVSVVAAQTTLVVAGGTLDMAGANPLGGAKKVTLAGGRLSITGDTSDPTPWDLPAGMSLHLDASTLVGTVADGAGVTQWADISGNGRQADVEADLYPERVPTFDQDGLNGYPAVRFEAVFHDGVQDTTIGDVMRVLPGEGGNLMAQEVFIVSALEGEYAQGPNSLGGVNAGCCIALLGGGDFPGWFGQEWSPSPPVRTMAIDDYNGSFTQDGGDILINGSDERVPIYNPGAYGAPIPDGPMIVDFLSTETRTMSGNTPLWIGADGYPTGAESNRNFPGPIAEIIMYEEALDDTARAQVGYYLAHKYGMDTEYRSPVPAMVMTDVDFTVTADSTLHMDTDYSAELGTLILKSGSVTLTGAPEGIGFTGTKIDPAATTVGFDPQTEVNFRVIDGQGSSAVLSKTGSSEYTMDNPANTGMQNASVGVSEGVLTVVENSLGGSTNLSLAGGTMIVTPVPGDGTPAPLPTAGLSLHLDASTITGLANGDPVALWPDSSGNGRNAIQDVLSSQPEYRNGANGINGVPSVYFAGISVLDGVIVSPEEGDVMLAPRVGDPTMAQEVFVVTTLEEPYAGDGSNAWEYGCCVTLLSQDADGQVIGAPWYDRNVLRADRFDLGGEVRIDGTDSIAFTDGPMLADIVAGAPRDMGNLVIGNSSSTYDLAADWRQRNWHGHIAEIIMYEETLTDVQRGQVGYYLEQKYGLDTGYEPPVPPLAMTDVDVTVIGDATLQADTDTTADFGTLILNNGIVTLTGAPDGITFTGTTVDAPGGGTVGFNLDTPVQFNQIDVASTDPVTISKGGLPDMVLTGANAGTGLQHATFEVREGRLIGLQEAANPFGSGANAAGLGINGGELVLASTGDVTYDNALSVESDGILTAGTGGVGTAGPLTVTLGTSEKGVLLNNGTLTVRTTDEYRLNVAGNFSGTGSVTVTEGTVALSGTASSVGNLKVTDSTVSTAGNDVTIGKTLQLGNHTFQISDGGSLAVQGTDLTAGRLLTLGSGTMTATGAGVLPDGLVMHWKFDETEGAIASEEVSGYNGAVTGAIWFDDPQRGGVIKFDADSQYVDVPDALAAFESAGVNEEITISVFQFGDVDAQPRNDYLFEGRNAAGQRGLNVHMPWSDQQVYWDAGFSYGRINKGATEAEYEGSWHHWTFTKKMGEMKIYLDGVEWHSGTGQNQSLVGVSNFKIGSNGNGTENYRGLIDDMIIFDRVLEAGEVEDVYQASLNRKYTTDVMDFSGTDVLVTGNASIDSPALEATFGNLTVQSPVTSLDLQGAVYSFQDAAIAGGVTVTGEMSVRGALDVGDGVAGTVTVGGDSELAFGSDATYNAEVILGDAPDAAAPDQIVLAADSTVYLDGTLAPKAVGRTSAGFFSASTMVTVIDNSVGSELTDGGDFAPHQFPAVDPAPAADSSAHIGQGAFLRDVAYVHENTFITQAVDLDLFVALGGDSDGDGKVWLSDWAALRANFGNTGTGKTWTEGNFDPWVDDKVWLSDWAALRANFGNAS